MTKEQLIALGLTEEQADKVIAAQDKEHMVPKSRLDDKIQEAKDLQEQLDQRDKDLKKLKKDAEGNADLQKKYDDLETKYKDDKAEHEKQLKLTQKSSAIKLALAGKVHDADLVATLIDGEAIELDNDGNVSKGLDDQVKTLKESKSFLFVEENKKPPTVKGARPSEGDPGGEPPASVGAQFAQNANESSKPAENTPWG